MLNLSHPKKDNEDKLLEWVQNTLLPRIWEAEHDPFCLHGYTNGSASKKGGKHSTGFILFHRPDKIEAWAK